MTTTRRRFLKTVASAGLVGIAGCSGGESASTTTPTPSTPTTTASQTASPTSTSTATPSPTATPRQKQVDMLSIDDCQDNCFRFKPETIEIETGMQVKWVNQGPHAHTVTAYEDEIPDEAEYFASGGFDNEQAARDGFKEEKTGIIEQGSPYTHVFDVPGEYDYFCIPHEFVPMKGTVNVL